MDIIPNRDEVFASIRQPSNGNVTIGQFNDIYFSMKSLIEERLTDYEKLKADNDRLRGALEEADEYLDSLHGINEISTGSILHRQFKQALKDTK